MRSSEYDNDNPDLQTALRLARLALSSPDVSVMLGSDFRKRYKRPVSSLLRGDTQKVACGYSVDVSTIGAVVTPGGLGQEYKDIITERTRIGIRREARTKQRHGWPVLTTLTEYQKALLHTEEGERIPVVRKEGTSTKPLIGRERYRPEIWHGTNVTPVDDPTDSLYVLRATLPSSDGRGPENVIDEITFSHRDILGDVACSSPYTIGPVALDRQRAIGILIDRLTQMPEAEERC